MPDGQLTPEEKLLRIIESPTGSGGAMRPQRRRQDFKLTWKLLKAKYGEKIKDLFNLKAVNMILFCVGFLITIFLVIDFWLGIPRPGLVDRIELLAKAQAIGDLTIERLDPVAVYLQEITQRNVFSLPEPLQDTSAAAIEAENKQEVASMSSELRLVGILWSDTPQAIVEDTKDQRTHLLNRGASIRRAKVKEILKDKVVLSYDNQDIEIK